MRSPEAALQTLLPCEGIADPARICIYGHGF